MNDNGNENREFLNYYYTLNIFSFPFCDRQRYSTKLSIQVESNPQGWIGINWKISTHMDLF